MTTTQPPSITVLVCSECGTGNYRRSVLTGKVTCTHCQHPIYEGDIELDPGESLAWDGPNGRLGYTTD